MEELTPILTRVFNHVLSNRNLPVSWSEAIISVIHKEGKDPTLCESYRPISLLNNDLKLLTSILAKRVQKVIAKLINPDQTGFILFWIFNVLMYTPGLLENFYSLIAVLYFTLDIAVSCSVFAI